MVSEEDNEFISSAELRRNRISSKGKHTIALVIETMKYPNTGETIKAELGWWSQMWLHYFFETLRHS